MTNTVSRSISDATLSRIVDIESAGRANAKASTSTALGLGQFLNGTWLAEIQKHRPDLCNGPPYDDELALRTNPALAIELLARFTEDNAAELGAGYGDGDLYLAHFAGAGTARKLLHASPEALASTVFSRQAVAANRSVIEGKTCRQVRDWAARKMAHARTDWVQHFIAAPAPRPRPAPPADEEPPEMPAPAPRRQPDDPGPELEQPAPVVKPSLFTRIRNWIAGIASGGGAGLLAYLTDPWVVVAIGGVLLVAAIALVLFIGPARVRNWIIGQFT